MGQNWEEKKRMTPENEGSCTSPPGNDDGFVSLVFN